MAATDQFSLRAGLPVQQGGAITYVTGLDAARTALKWTTTLPGGFNQLDVGIIDATKPQYGVLPVPVELRPFGHVVVRAGAASRSVFEGRIMKLKRVGGDVRGFTAVGYGVSLLKDAVYINGSATVTTAGAVLKDLLNTCAPYLSLGNNATVYQDTGAGHAPSEFSGQQAAQVVDALTKEGGGASGSTVWDWSVWENGQARWLPRTAPQQPTYDIPFDLDVDWEDDYENALSSVYVRYQNSGSTTINSYASSPASAFVSQYGLARQIVVDGGVMTSGLATQFGKSFQSQHTGPEAQITISRDRHRGMERPGGAEQDPALVRAGEWVTIGGEGPFIIIQTDYDANAGTLRAQCAFHPTRGVYNLLSRLVREMSAIRNKVQPQTGTRAAV